MSHTQATRVHGSSFDLLVQCFLFSAFHSLFFLFPPPLISSTQLARLGPFYLNLLLEKTWSILVTFT